MASRLAPRYYHGAIPHAEAEARLLQATQRYPSQRLFLVRQNDAAGSRDHVLTTFTCGCSSPADQPRIAHYNILRVQPAGYALQSEGPVPTFADVDALVQYYKDHDEVPGPLGIFVPAPAGPPKSQTPEGGEVPGIPRPNDVAELLCEGYLTKKRTKGQSRKRFFRLTNRLIGYYEKDGGPRIAAVTYDEVAALTDLDKTSFRLVTKIPFCSPGQSYCEMVLEAPSQSIKIKWLAAIRREIDKSGALRRYAGRLLAEGYLTKVQSGASTSKSRWFALTDLAFAYFREEGGEEMGTVSLDNVLSVLEVDKRSIRVVANTRFTVTGAREVLLKCESEAVRKKWMANFRRVIPAEKFLQTS